jgi:hypothetical protein
MTIHFPKLFLHFSIIQSFFLRDQHDISYFILGLNLAFSALRQTQYISFFFNSFYVLISSWQIFVNIFKY